MNGHPEYLELIAASIDFELTDEEFGRLSTHLARCPECRAAADEIRGDAAGIAAYPPPRLAPARSEQILRAALRTPPARPRWGLLAVAALLATLGGGVLFAGFQLIQDDDSTPQEPPPSLVAEASAPPSEAPTEEPDEGGVVATDAPSLDPTPTPKQQPAPAQLALPLLNDWSIGPVRLAPAANDRLWVAFVRGPETILALLDSAGRPVAGWPIAVPHTEGCVPHAASDGSVRLLCSSSPDDPARCPDGCMEDTVFAWTAAAKKVRGFPVVIASSPGSGAFRETARLIDDNLFVVRVDEEEDGDTFTIEHSLVEVRPDGALVMGTRMPSTICCTISADGIAFGSDYRVDDGPERTHMIAFDGRGMRTGWPITLDGFVTPPSFGPGGQLLASAWYHGEEETTSAILRLNPNGTSAAEPVQIAEAITWDPGVDGPLAPLADNRGRAWVVANGMVLGYDAQTDLPGFPYDAETGLVTRGDECGPEDTGCQSWIDPPRVAARGLIYSLEEAPSGKGERITVVNPDGSIRSGWPKTLQREGSAWESVTLGENNVAYAVAVEPEPQGQPSVSILAFAPNGTREWITTLVEP